MGMGRWDSADWDSYKTTYTAGKTTDKIFTSRAMKDDMDPRKITVRESRDSEDNPLSTPIILALDVTGSMGVIADNMARESLGTLVKEILDRKPVSDPHIMVMGVGDADYDDAPLQASQFESDIRIAEQLKEIYLEHGGGNNDCESYTLPWYFAARKTDIDSVHHGRKGMLFTFGDEECPAVLTREQIERATGDIVQADISTADLLALVSQKYDVFHVVVEEGSHARYDRDAVYNSWSNVLPQGRIIHLSDYTKVAEVLVSVMEVHAGKAPEVVTASWSGSTAVAVRNAVTGMVAANDSGSTAAAVWRPTKGRAHGM